MEESVPHAADDCRLCSITDRFIPFVDALFQKALILVYKQALNCGYSLPVVQSAFPAPPQANNYLISAAHPKRTRVPLLRFALLAQVNASLELGRSRLLNIFTPEKPSILKYY